MKNKNTSKRKLRRQKKELKPPKPKRLTKKQQRKEKKREQMRIEQEQERQRRMKQIFRCVHYDMDRYCYYTLHGRIRYEDLFLWGPSFWPDLEPISETECQCRICKKVLPIDQWRKLEQAAAHVKDAGKHLDKSLVSKLVEGIEPGYFRGLGGEEIEYLASLEQPDHCYMWPDGTIESIEDYQKYPYWRWGHLDRH